MTDDEKPITVEGLLRMPERITRQIEYLAGQQLLMTQLFPPPVLTRRQRFVGRLWEQCNEDREWLALKIAPWLS